MRFNRDFEAKLEAAASEVERLTELRDAADGGSNRRKVLNRALKKAENVERQLTEKAEQIEELINSQLGRFIDSQELR